MSHFRFPKISYFFKCKLEYFNFGGRYLSEIVFAISQHFIYPKEQQKERFMVLVFSKTNPI